MICHQVNHRQSCEINVIMLGSSNKESESYLSTWPVLEETTVISSTCQPPCSGPIISPAKGPSSGPTNIESRLDNSMLVTMDLHSKRVHLSCFDVENVHIMAASLCGYQTATLQVAGCIRRGLVRCLCKVTVGTSSGVCDAYQESRLHQSSLSETSL